MANLEIYHPDLISRYTNRGFVLSNQEWKLSLIEDSSLHNNTGPTFVTEGIPNKRQNVQVEIVNSNIVTIDDIITCRGNIPAGKFFVCRIISPCKEFFDSVDAVVEDAEGKRAICLKMYNTTPYLRLKLELGRILAIKNPWLQHLLVANLVLCVDSPGDIIHDVSILNKLNVEWKGEIPRQYSSLKKTTFAIEKYRQLGNAEFVKKNYVKARHFYSEGLVKFPNDIDILSNRAATFLHLRLFSLALSDAELVLFMQENHSKAIYRKTKALCGLGKYAEAQSFIAKKINKAQEKKIKLENLGELQKLKSHVEKLVNQSKTGEFDVMELLQNCDAEYLDVAEYTSDFEVIPIEGKGRGTVARKDFSPGELIMANRALEIAFLEDMTFQAAVGDELLFKIIQRMVDEPDKVVNVYNLYAGPNFAPVTTGEADIDVKRLRGIDHNNVYSLLAPGTLKKRFGLWILASFLNHSCVDYNARWQVFGDIIFIRAVRSIAKNEEIVVPYSIFRDFEEKNDFFQDMSFRCNCRLCQAEKAVGQTVLKRADEIAKKGLQLRTVNEVRRAIEELEEVTGNNKMSNMVHEKLYHRLVCLCMESKNYEGFLMISKKLYDDVEHIHIKVVWLTCIYELSRNGVVPCDFPLEKCTQEVKNTLGILFGPSNVPKLMKIPVTELTKMCVSLLH